MKKRSIYCDDEEELDIPCESLYDEYKLKLLKVAFEKYSLEELQKKLKIKNNEY